MKQRIASIIFTLLLVAGCVWWFATMHQVEELTYVGLKGDARDDPFLALKRLLRGAQLRLEEPAASAKPGLKLDNLPQGGTVLLSDRRHLLMTPERVQALVAWVEAGGHLIVEAEYPGRPDPLLAALDLARKDLVYPKPTAVPPPKTHDGDDKDEDDAREEKAEKAEKALPPPKRTRGPPRRSSEIAEVSLPDGGRPLKVEFAAYQNLELGQRQYQFASDKLGVRFATGTRGAGRVSALSNFDFLIYRGVGEVKKPEFQRTHIGKHDHAEFVLRLVRLHPTHASAPMRLVWSRDDVSLWSWLVEHALMVLVSAAVLLLLGLWRVIPRFGPLVPELRPAEQKLSSHLEAAGRFYWKHLGPGEVYGKLSAAFMQRLSERRPGIVARKSTERNAELARLAAVTEEAVARALDHPAQGVTDLVRNAVLLQRISQKL